MSHDAPSSGAETVIVIGSGPSAAVAAAKLIERDIDVTMLDAGPRAPGGAVVRVAGNTVYRRMGYSLYETDRLDRRTAGEVMWVSSRSHGGLSNYWTAAVPRFAPSDFTEGERLDERFVWPVGYDELEPFYDAVDEQLCVTTGGPIVGLPENIARHRWAPPADWRDVVHRARTNGDGVGPIPMAKGDPWMAVRRGTEFSSYHCVIRPLESASRFDFRPNAHVVRLAWKPSKGRVDAVEYIDRSTGETVQLPARAVVLAAGTVDSTMILQRSVSRDFPAGLGNGNGVVGRYLHDHPREWWPAHTSRPMRALSHPLYVARADPAHSEPLMACSHTIGLVRPRDRLRTYVRARTNSLGVQVFGTMIPEPEFGIELRDTTANAVDHRPVIRLRYSQQAEANMRRARTRLSDVLGRAGLATTVGSSDEPLRPGSSVHLAGTVRMHDDPRFGAVDRWNRMHDVPNVVVSDMSCFTTGPEKNPTPTAMALSMRAADRLADELR